MEQNIRGPIPDVLTLHQSPGPGGRADRDEDGGGVAIAERVPRTRLTQLAEIDSYLRKASRVTVRHRHGEVVAVIEIVSPGNKASRAEFRTLVEKSADWLRQGIHLLIVDLFPPGNRDPQGIHTSRARGVNR